VNSGRKSRVSSLAIFWPRVDGPFWSRSSATSCWRLFLVLTDRTRPVCRHCQCDPPNRDRSRRLRLRPNCFFSRFARAEWMLTAGEGEFYATFVRASIFDSVAPWLCPWLWSRSGSSQPRFFREVLRPEPRLLGSRPGLPNQFWGWFGIVRLNGRRREKSRQRGRESK
jgi:hypothetical protein